MTTYRVVHRTEYTYDEEVTSSYGRAHLRPRDIDGQRCVWAAVVVDPHPAEQRDHVDFFGNVSSYFAVREPHRRLAVVSSAEVQVDRTRFVPAELGDLSWERARDSLPPNDHARAFVLSSPRIEVSADVEAYGARFFTPGRPIGAAVEDLTRSIYREFSYDSKATTVRTTLPEVLVKRAGVCQDFAHLAVGCLRSVGLPARYVSGYLETYPAPGQVKLAGSDASHAWASVLVPGFGWVDLDPTNDQFVDDRYLVVACGRDYADVPPLKGVIVTDAKTSTMTVGVDVTRLASHPA